MGLGLTLTFALVAAAMAIVFGWLGARSPDPKRGPRLIPWRMLMALSAAMALLMIVHLANLAGVTTGR
jgi:hypothetical protein